MSQRRNSLILLATIALTSPVIVQLHARTEDGRETDRKPFQLSERELARLSDRAPSDCAAALMVARHHLYASLDLKQARKFFRLANRCPSIASLEGLLAVLRDPTDDAEVDKLVAELKKLDPKKGKSAAQEIELRRLERGAK